MRITGVNNFYAERFFLLWAQFKGKIVFTENVVEISGRDYFHMLLMDGEQEIPDRFIVLLDTKLPNALIVCGYTEGVGCLLEESFYFDNQIKKWKYNPVKNAKHRHYFERFVNILFDRHIQKN